MCLEETRGFGCEFVIDLACNVVTFVGNPDFVPLIGVDSVTLLIPVITQNVVFIVPLTAIAPAFFEHAARHAIAALAPVSLGDVTHALITIGGVVLIA